MKLAAIHAHARLGFLRVGLHLIPLYDVEIPGRFSGLVFVARCYSNPRKIITIRALKHRFEVNWINGEPF